MKKTFKIFGLFAVAAMTVIGCAKEEEAQIEEIINEEPQEQSVLTHTVTITAGSPETKTVINEGVSSASFKWSSDDATRFHIWENDVEGSSIALETSDGYATIKLTATFATVTDDSYTYTAYLANNEYDDSGDLYPEVPTAQTCTGTSYDPNADILIAQPVTNEGSVLSKIDMKFGRPCVINKMTLKGLTAGETLSSVEIRADKDLTGYYDIAGKTWTGESSKIVLTTSQTVPATGQVVVYFVTMPVSAATLTVTAITDAHVYDKTFTKTINFVMDQVTTFGVSSLTQYVKRDVLTLPLTTVSGTSYADFSSKSYAGAGHSSAVYAGTIAGGNDAIQLNANSGTSYRGIVSTTSGGSIQKVRVSWESHTANDRSLTIYGKNTAYTTSDLNNSFGTELGSVTCGSSVQTSIASYYEYIMLKAAKAIYLDEIEIFWDDTKSDSGLKWTADGNSGDAVAAADASIETGDDTMPAAALYNPNGISLSEITFSSSDTDVATIGEHTGVITLVGGGDATISAVFAGNATYKPANVSYDLTVTDSRSTCATPSFSEPAGSVTANTVVRISAATDGATIHYTTNGDVPTTESTASTLSDGSGYPYVDITIDVAKTLKAIAVKDDYKNSSLATSTYTITGVGVKLDNPSGIALTAFSKSAFTASWTAVDNASSYDWVLSTSSTADGIAAGNTKASGNVTSATCSDSALSLTTGTYYLYVKTKGNGTSYLDSDGYDVSHRDDAILISIDFTSTDQRPVDFPSGSAAKLDATSYTIDGYSFEFYGGTDCRWTSYLIFGKSGAYVKTPAISGKKLSTVHFTTTSGCSTNVIPKVMSTDGSSTVYNNASKMAQSRSYSWSLSSPVANTRYRFQVTNGYNMQVAKMDLVFLN